MDTPPPTIPSPFRLLLGVNLRQAWRGFQDASNRSSFLSWMVAMFLCGYPLLSAGLFYWGLRYVSRFPGLGDLLIERLVFLLFAFLFMLLLISNLVVGYTNLFRNRETTFLLTLPVGYNDVFRWKFLESSVVASWAFLLLIAPLLAAFGVHQKAPWPFYLLLPVLVALFIILPAVLGAWGAILLARYLDRSLFQMTALIFLVGAIYAIKVYLQPEIAHDEVLEKRVVDVTDRLLAKTRFAQFPFLPSYWLSSSIIHWLSGALSLAFFFVMVLVANVIFIGLLGITRTGRRFHSAVSTTLSRGSLAGDWVGASHHASRVCAQLIVLAFFLPFLNLQPLTGRFHAEILPAARTFEADRKDPDVTRDQLRGELKTITARAQTILGAGTLGALRDDCAILETRYEDGDLGPLNLEFQQLTQLNLNTHLSGLSLTRGHGILKGPALRARERDPPAAAVPTIPPLLLGILPLLAVVAWIANRPALHFLSGLAPIAMLAWIATQSSSLTGAMGGSGTIAAGLAPLQWLGGGAWLALLAGLAQITLAFKQKEWASSLEANLRARAGRKRAFHFRAGLLEKLTRAVPLVSSDARALLLKDFRVFWRDTTQWGQSLILFGILGAYIINLRYFTQQFTSSYWVHVVSYMNLAACSLALATLTTRFVYPQFSLEGTRLWIVGLAPLGLVRVVKVKLALAIFMSLVITLPLVWLSCHMLNLPQQQTFYFSGAIACMALTLNSLAFSVGVLHPDLKEDNPSKIVSGFGGTFCLVVSFVYIGAAVVFLGQGSPWGSPWHLFGPPSVGVRVTALASFILLSLGLGLAPLLYALRKVRHFEH